MAQSRQDTMGRKPVDCNPDIESTLFMIHHVFLPPKLPQEDDFAPGLDGVLVDTVLKFLGEFNGLNRCNRATIAVTSMVENFRAIHHESGVIIEARLQDTLAKLSKDGKSHYSTLRHIADFSRLRYRSVTRQGPERWHAHP
jgi:hypothetical protein